MQKILLKEKIFYSILGVFPVQMSQDNIPAGGVNRFGHILQVLDFVVCPLGGIAFCQLVVSSAHIRAGVDCKLHQYAGFLHISGFQKHICPFLQSAYQYGVILIIF